MKTTLTARLAKVSAAQLAARLAGRPTRRPTRHFNGALTLRLRLPR